MPGFLISVNSCWKYHKLVIYSKLLTEAFPDSDSTLQVAFQEEVFKQLNGMVQFSNVWIIQIQNPF